MAFQPRDAHGRFIPRATWELAYRLAGQRAPSRVGRRNQIAPLTVQDVQRRTRKPAKLKHQRTARPVRKIVQDVKQRDRGFRAGTEFELTATYKGKSRGGEVLHLKIRVTLDSPMTAETARLLLDRSVRDGVVPPGISVSWMDWRRGSGGPRDEGHYDDPDHAELKAFYQAITRSRTRFERVREEEE